MELLIKKYLYKEESEEGHFLEADVQYPKK